MKLALSYISFEFECVSGSIWFWLGCWVVWRSVTTSSVITSTTLTPRPPVPSSAPTTLHLSLTSQTGIVNLLVATDFTTLLGMARTSVYSYNMYRCLYKKLCRLTYCKLLLPRSHAHTLSSITTEAS